MNLLGQSACGILMLGLLCALVIIKRAATGSVIDRPGGALLARVVNTFNLFFLLIANPLAAVLLLAHRAAIADPGHVRIDAPRLLATLELCGVGLYCAGFALMAWALIGMGRYYQLGGSVPRSGDSLITTGPYRLVRHPMYTAALCISLGLALMIQSLSYLLVFFAYTALILPLVRAEEEGLRRAYGEQYREYARRVKRIVPYIY